MSLCGIPTCDIARSRKGQRLTDYEKGCIRQMKYATDLIEKSLKGE